MGTKKLYTLLEPFMLAHQIKMGRDALFDLLAAQGLLVKRRKRRINTTQSSHWLRKYPNLTEDYTPSRSNELWVSDITYWFIGSGVVYVSLITDAYSRKVVGYHVADTLEAIHPLSALQMALHEATTPLEGLIHHSDRGTQYCSKLYVNLLEGHEISISMSDKGAALDNSKAERMNGILKEEYLHNYEVADLSDAQNLAKEMIKRYNEERPHGSIGYMFPSVLHEENQSTERLWKNYYAKKEQRSEGREQTEDES